jgi:hypothetical protein
MQRNAGAKFPQNAADDIVRCCPREANGFGEDTAMRGYYTYGGYYGFVSGKYMLFASEGDYYDYMTGENA